MKRSTTSGSWLVAVSDMGILSGSGKAGAAGSAGSAGGAGGAGRASRSRQPWMLYAFTVPQLNKKQTNFSTFRLFNNLNQCSASIIRLYKY